MPLTHEQEALIAAAARGESIEGQALAGSGKTFTLVEAAKPMTPGLVLAFNVSIKDEAKERFPSTWVCSTMNGLGHKAIWSYFRKPITVSAKKLDAWLPSGDDYIPTRDLVNLARQHGIIPREFKKEGINPDDHSLWRVFADDLDIPEDDADRLIDNARAILASSIKEIFSSQTVDFDDQIYFSLLWDCPFPKYRTIILDEAQDLSPMQHKMVRRTLAPGGQLVAAGDSHQAIYGFRGADYQSMARLSDMFKLTQYQLNTCFRCSQAVVEHAQEIVPYMRWKDDAPEGEVRFHKTWDPFMIEDQDFVICRNNAPLVSMAFRLIKEGRPVRLKSQKGLGLKTLIAKFKSAPNITQFLTRLEKWEKEEVAKAKETKKFAKISRIRDKADVLRVICEMGSPRDVNELQMQADRLTGGKAGPILMTGHKSKGLEAHTVWHLNHYLIGKGFEDAPLSEAQMEQEQNLDYVIRTRAKHTLNYINLSRK